MYHIHYKIYIGTADESGRETGRVEETNPVDARRVTQAVYR